MKTLKLPFCHPVHGKISFCCPKDGTVKSMDINSNENNEIDISFEGIASGAWNITFEWEQNEEQFSLSRSVVIE